MSQIAAYIPDETARAEAQTAQVCEADYRLAFLIRETETRFLQLFSEGRLHGTVHTCIGQEWSGIAIARALQPGDTVCTNHRGHGHYLARTGDVRGLVAEVMGRSSGVVCGRGGSQHLCSEGFYSNGIQGGMVPIAAGLAWRHKRKAENKVSIVFIGDGTLGEGIFYETLNIAAKHQLPLLVVVENNGYAQSTPQDQTLSGNISDRARAFGIAWAKGDTWHPAELFQMGVEAVNLVRTEHRPFILQIDTYRLMAHSKGDDDRSPKELNAYQTRDLLNSFARDVPQKAEAMIAEAREIVNEAVAAADAHPLPELAAPILPIVDTNFTWKILEDSSNERVVQRIHDALQRNMRRNSEIVLLGEDIEGPYGGAFKVTKNLSAEFPGRVVNMPISEAAIVGLGSGLAMGGFRPVCEIMFGDFLLLAADQIVNHATKFRDMYADKVSVPLVIRTPMGGRRGYGPTHSQSLEKHFLGVPGLTVLALNHRYDPARLYGSLFESVSDPTLVVENKILYGMHVGSEVPAGFRYETNQSRFPTIRLCSDASPSVTIICYGAMLAECEASAGALFDEEEVVAEVICPTQLYPLDLTPILQSVSRTHRLVVVEEGQNFAAFGAEVVASLVERMPMVGMAVARVAPQARAIPSSGELEKIHLPGRSEIIAAVLDLIKK